ncbi:hypothetical protein NC652_027243 [Populus alba x Populus x berolinensis]|nr:hypothetical protein NC652_027243 [Populus alba x Populus x berolinensis]
MGSLTISEIPYIAAMNGDWERMIDYYQEHGEFLYSPVTLSLDSGFHLAVHSNAERPLKDLLEIMGVIEFLTGTRNKFGNTVLHEATIYGNYEAVRLLVERCPGFISIPNVFGETPLFTAAAFGEAKIVEYLIASKPEECVDCNGCILSIHRQRSKDDLSILGAAIIGQHFETALLLLELDESLHDLEDKMGRTALQLLAEMPTGFESGYPMGIFERLIYNCLPVIRHHEVKSQVRTWCRAKKRDLESGTPGSSLEKNRRGSLLNYLKVPKGVREQQQGERDRGQLRRDPRSAVVSAESVGRRRRMNRVCIREFLLHRNLIDPGQRQNERWILAPMVPQNRWRKGRIEAVGETKIPIYAGPHSFALPCTPV